MLTPSGKGRGGVDGGTLSLFRGGRVLAGWRPVTNQVQEVHKGTCRVRRAGYKPFQVRYTKVQCGQSKKVHKEQMAFKGKPWQQKLFIRL